MSYVSNDCYAVVYRGMRCVRRAVGFVTRDLEGEISIVPLCLDHLESARDADSIRRNPRTGYFEFRKVGQEEKVFAFKSIWDEDPTQWLARNEGQVTGE